MKKTIFLINLLLVSSAVFAAEDQSNDLMFGILSLTQMGLFIFTPPIIYLIAKAINDDLSKPSDIWNINLLVLYIFMAFILLLGFLLGEDVDKILGATEIMATMVGALMGFIYDKVTSSTKEEILANQAKALIVAKDVDGKLTISLRTIEASAVRLKSFIEQLSGKEDFEKKIQYYSNCY